ncbi:MAG: hypothetical protein A2X46_05840 [Lentisphaerae bacterium GWF2_57_35]|nr:MAG: hypothetical protein A2X46_05840 [Lentisphaerae bacterium GWF2_57_35]
MGIVAAFLASSVLLWNYAGSFNGDILGFYRIGAVLPHSPYLTPDEGVRAQGEVGYDGQFFLSIALDPFLSHAQSLASLDNPRYRYRRILFPMLGYALSLGRHSVIPFMLVIINAVCFVSLVVVVARLLADKRSSTRGALFVLGIPGFWCSLLLTTSDLMASLFLALTLLAFTRQRYKSAALWYGLAGLTHETMLAAAGALALPLLFNKQFRCAGAMLWGCIPVILWNLFVFYHVPSVGSTSGILENFTLPGAGLVQKFMSVSAGPFNAKWLFDSAVFLLLCATLGFLLLSTGARGGLRFALPCVLVYAAFFICARITVLAYYPNLLRVYANVLLLFVISLACPLWPKASRVVLLAWTALGVIFVTAYSQGLI